MSISADLESCRPFKRWGLHERTKSLRMGLWILICAYFLSDSLFVSLFLPQCDQPQASKILWIYNTRNTDKSVCVFQQHKNSLNCNKLKWSNSLFNWLTWQVMISLESWPLTFSAAFILFLISNNKAHITLYISHDNTHTCIIHTYMNAYLHTHTHKWLGAHRDSLKNL